MIRRIVVVITSMLLSLVFASSAMAGVLSVAPPAQGGATCIGPAWGTPAVHGAWNAHFNGAAPDETSAVIHEPACPH